jgi:hypothetical protein
MLLTFDNSTQDQYHKMAYNSMVSNLFYVVAIYWTTFSNKSHCFGWHLWLKFIGNCENINVKCNMTTWNIWNKAKPQMAQIR